MPERTEASSVTSPATSSAPAERTEVARAGSRTSARTSWPPATRRGTTWLPRKPVEPVTNTFIALTPRRGAYPAAQEGVDTQGAPAPCVRGMDPGSASGRFLGGGEEELVLAAHLLAAHERCIDHQ